MYPKAGLLLLLFALSARSCADCGAKEEQTCGCSTNSRDGKPSDKYSANANNDGSLVSSGDTDDPWNLEERTNEMVHVPGGIFLVGTDKPVFIADGESPRRFVEIDDLWLDKYEVSNAEFARFVAATQYVTEAETFGNSFVLEAQVSPEVKAGIKSAVAAAPWWLPVDGADWRHPSGPDSRLTWNHPVVHVSWNDAVAYCAWAGKRLPTEAEWEIACSGSKDGDEEKLFPWGNKKTPGHHKMNIWQGKFPTNDTGDDGFAGTAPVAAFGTQNDLGLCNLIGNVWEWVEDWWKINHRPAPNPEQAPKNPVGGGIGRTEEKVKKGGSFMCTKEYCYRYRCAARSQNTPDSSASNLGFRCASSSPPVLDEHPVP